MKISLPAVVALALVGCSSSSPPAPQSTVALPPGPRATSGPAEAPREELAQPTSRDTPPGEECRALPGWKGDVPHRGDAPPPTAGQMTEEAAVAKRLFDSEKWPEAERALARVAEGRTHDDEGNRHIADYFRAIALFRLARYEEAAARFRVFSRSPAHLKFAESLLWIVRIATTAPQAVKLDDVALYTPAELARFDNTHQREIFGRASYLLGHQRYDEGNVTEAKLLLENARRVGPWSRQAQVCLDRLAKSSPR